MDARIAEFQCIMTMENIASVLARGILSNDQAAKLAHTSVALQDVQDRRRAARVMCLLLISEPLREQHWRARCLSRIPEVAQLVSTELGRCLRSTHFVRDAFARGNRFGHHIQHARSRVLVAVGLGQFRLRRQAHPVGEHGCLNDQQELSSFGHRGHLVLEMLWPVRTGVQTQGCGSGRANCPAQSSGAR